MSRILCDSETVSKNIQCTLMCWKKDLLFSMSFSSFLLVKNIHKPTILIDNFLTIEKA